MIVSGVHRNCTERLRWGLLICYVDIKVHRDILQCWQSCTGHIIIILLLGRSLPQVSWAALPMSKAQTKSSETAVATCERWSLGFLINNRSALLCCFPTLKRSSPERSPPCLCWQTARLGLEISVRRDSRRGIEVQLSGAVTSGS